MINPDRHPDNANKFLPKGWRVSLKPQTQHDFPHPWELFCNDVLVAGGNTINNYRTHREVSYNSIVAKKISEILNKLQKDIDDEQLEKSTKHWEKLTSESTEAVLTWMNRNSDDSSS